MLADGTVNGRHEGIRNGHYGMAPPPPHDYTRINDEDIHRIEFIESGGQGSVYRGTWNNGGKVVDVAIKIATHNTPELKVLQRVRHKNIVHFYGAIEKVGHQPQIVMGKPFKARGGGPGSLKQLLIFGPARRAGPNDILKTDFACTV
eukprot:sb/3473779/